MDIFFLISIYHLNISGSVSREERGAIGYWVGSGWCLPQIQPLV